MVTVNNFFFFFFVMGRKSTMKGNAICLAPPLANNTRHYSLFKKKKNKNENENGRSVLGSLRVRWLLVDDRPRVAPAVAVQLSCPFAHRFLSPSEEERENNFFYFRNLPIFRLISPNIFVEYKTVTAQANPQWRGDSLTDKEKTRVRLENFYYSVTLMIIYWYFLSICEVSHVLRKCYENNHEKTRYDKLRLEINLSITHINSEEQQG